MTDDESAESTPIRQRIPWWKLANVLGLLILIAVVVPFLIFAVPQTVGADHSYVVTSGSMEPNISLGSAVIVKQVPTERIQVNDVITFQSGDDPRTTTHRVIEVTEQDGQRAFRTKGDANEDPDQSLVVPGQNARVEGRVMTIAGEPFAIPYIGYAVQFTKTQTGFTALVIVPFVLLVLNEVWNVIASASPDPDDGTAAATEAEAETETESASETDEPEHASAPIDSQGETAAPGAEAAAEAEDDDEAITLLATELRLAIAALGAFLAYSVWVAYATSEFWAFAVTAGVGTAFLLLSGLYLTGRMGSGEETTAESAADEAVEETSPESDESENVLDPKDIVGPEIDPAGAEDSVGLDAGETDPLFLDEAVTKGDIMASNGTNRGELDVENEDAEAVAESTAGDGSDTASGEEQPGD